MNRAKQFEAQSHIGALMLLREINSKRNKQLSMNKSHALLDKCRKHTRTIK